jgi:hypothetical protein
LLLNWIRRGGVEDVGQHISVRHGVDGCGGRDEVDPKLLVRLGRVMIEGWWAAQWAGACPVHGQVDPELTIQSKIPV